MKKFSDISKKEVSLDFKKNKQKLLSNDINLLNSQLKNSIDGTKLDGEWEIIDILSISTKEPSDDNLKETIVINAEIGNNTIKRGDYIYITALINKKGNYVNQNQMGVLKVKVVDIYNNLFVLNQLK